MERNHGQQDAFPRELGFVEGERYSIAGADLHNILLFCRFKRPVDNREEAFAKKGKIIHTISATKKQDKGIGNQGETNHMNDFSWRFFMVHYRNHLRYGRPPREKTWSKYLYQERTR